MPSRPASNGAPRRAVILAGIRLTRVVRASFQRGPWPLRSGLDYFAMVCILGGTDSRQTPRQFSIVSSAGIHLLFQAEEAGVSGRRVV